MDEAGAADASHPPPPRRCFRCLLRIDRDEQIVPLPTEQ